MKFIQKIIDFLIRKKWLGILLVLGLVSGVGISTFYRGAISPKQRTDLTVFLIAGEMVAEGRANHIYGIENKRSWHYVYAPMLAIALAPISKWPLSATVPLAYFLSLACLAGTVMLSRRLPTSTRDDMPKSIPSPHVGEGKDEGALGFPHLTLSQKGEGKICCRPAKTGRQGHASVPESLGCRPAPWQIVLSMIFCLPMFLNTFTRGQLGIISLFFEAAIFYTYLARRKVLTGFLLAFAVTLKISPLGFLAFFFLMKREWKILISAAAGFFLFFFLLPSAAIGFQTNWALVKAWVGIMSVSQSDTAYQHYLWGELFTPFAEDNQSLYAVITRFIWPSEAQFVGHSNALVRLITSGCGILLLALPFIKTRGTSPSPERDPLRSLAEFSLFPMLMLFTSPVTQIHHYTAVYFLFLAALMMANRLELGSRSAKLLLISSWICALSLTMGMIFSAAGYWGIPLWGSMILWGVVLFCLPQNGEKDSLEKTQL